MCNIFFLFVFFCEKSLKWDEGKRNWGKKISGASLQMCGGKFTRWRKGGYSVEGKGEGGAYSGGGLEEYRIWDMVLFRMLLATKSIFPVLPPPLR